MKLGNNAMIIRLTSAGPIAAASLTISGARAVVAKICIGLLFIMATAATASASDADRGDIAIPLDELSQRAAGIMTSAVEADTSGQELIFPGTVVVPPHQSTIVASPAAGMIETILVAPDEPVKAGQVIARLRSPQVVEAQHLFLVALTDESLAADKLRRAEALFKVNAMSEVQLLLARGEHSHALARVDERLQILQLKGVASADIDELRKSRKIANLIEIQAPKDGVVIDRNVKQGTRVDAAAPLFNIAVLSPLWINIQVPTTRISLLKEGKAVSLPAHGARGRVIRVGKTIDQPTQSIDVVAEIDTNSGSVRPGLSTSVNVRVEGNAIGNWNVPVASVVRHRGRFWIFVQNASGFLARPVEVVLELGQRTSIKAELAPTDRIATQGVLALAAELAEKDER